MLGLPIKGSGEGNSDTRPSNESDWLNAHVHLHACTHMQILLGTDYYHCF